MAHYIQTILGAMTLAAIFLAQGHLLQGFQTSNGIEILIGSFYLIASLGTGTMLWRLIISNASAPSTTHPTTLR